MLMWINVLITHRSDGIFAHRSIDYSRWPNCNTPHHAYAQRGRQRQTKLHETFAHCTHYTSAEPKQRDREREREISLISTELLSKIPLYYGGESVKLHECRSREAGGWSEAYTMHISLCTTVFFSWVFERSCTNMATPSMYLCRTTLLYKACENTDVWYSVFHCRGKVSAAPVVSLMSLDWRHNR